MIETNDLILRPGAAADGPELYRSLWSQPQAFCHMFRRALDSETAGIARTAAGGGAAVRL